MNVFRVVNCSFILFVILHHVLMSKQKKSRIINLKKSKLYIYTYIKPNLAKSSYG
jgi:hypothetical protein